MRCWRCRDAFRKAGERLEKWGNVYSCGFCAKLMGKYTNSREHAEVAISSLPSNVADRYDFVNGLIEVGGGFRESESSLNMSHGIMHHTLFRRIGLKACFQYDNISQFGEIEEMIFNG